MEIVGKGSRFAKATLILPGRVGDGETTGCFKPIRLRGYRQFCRVVTAALFRLEPGNYRGILPYCEIYTEHVLLDERKDLVILG